MRIQPLDKYGASLILKLNGSGPSMEPCGTPVVKTAVTRMNNYLWKLTDTDRCDSTHFRAQSEKINVDI